jgi:hypothetical protein
VANGVFILLCLLVVSSANTKEPRTPSFEPATVVFSAEPVYPAMAMGAGTVVLAVSVDAAGETEHMKVIKGSEGFNRENPIDGCGLFTLLWRAVRSCLPAYDCQD